jgi:VanZ family protein
VVLSVLASSIYGISDEIHQYFVPSRMADIADVAANTVGSFMGAIAAQMSLNRQ